MEKDTFYFSHDFNTRQDSKIKKLIRTHGILGYGIFWAIVEDLYNNANALPTDYETIAFDLRTECDIVKRIINDFDLFVIDGDFFGSSSVEKRLERRNEKSKKAADSANARWSKVRENANALQSDCDANAIKERKQKETKKNQTKENEIKGNESKREDGYNSALETRGGAREQTYEEWKNEIENLSDEPTSPIYGTNEWTNTKNLTQKQNETRKTDTEQRC